MKKVFADTFGDKSMVPAVAGDTTPRIDAAAIYGSQALDDEIEILLLAAA